MLIHPVMKRVKSKPQKLHLILFSCLQNHDLCLEQQQKNRDSQFMQNRGALEKLNWMVWYIKSVPNLKIFMNFRRSLERSFFFLEKKFGKSSWKFRACSKLKVQIKYRWHWRTNQMETLKLPSEIFRNIVLTGNKIKRVHWEVWSRQMAVRKVRNIPPEETWQIGRSSSFKVWSWNASGTLYITQQSQIQWDWMQARWGPKKLKEKEMMMMEEWLPWSLLQLKKVAIKGDECVGICQNGCYILKCLCLLYKNGMLFFISVMQILAFISVLFL